MLPHDPPAPISAAERDAILERIAPIAVVKNLRFDVRELAHGYCQTVVPLDDRFVGAYGAYHGGLLATAADSVACLAIWGGIGADKHLTTSDLHIRYLAACFTDAIVEARVIKFGRTLCPVDVRIYDTNKRPVAAATVTYFFLDGAVEGNAR